MSSSASEGTDIQEYSYYESFYEDENEYTYYYSYEESLPIDSVVGIEILPEELCIQLCEGHQISGNTLDHMIEECVHRRIRLVNRHKRNKKAGEREKIIRLHQEQYRGYTFKCPALDSDGKKCDQSFPLEKILEQVSEKKQRRKLRKKGKRAAHRKMRKKAFKKIPTLAECPNKKCSGEHKCLGSLGDIPMRDTLKLYGNNVFTTSKDKLRHCLDCNWIWCTDCKGVYFSVGDLVDHRATTCAQVRLLTDVPKLERLSLELINKVAVACPGCGYAVALISGCNRVTCTHCSSFFCYLCHDQTWPMTIKGSTDAYNHLSWVHGGHSTWRTNKGLPPEKGSIDRLGLELDSISTTI